MEKRRIYRGIWTVYSNMSANRSFSGNLVCASCTQVLPSALHICPSCGRAYCERCSHKSFPLHLDSLTTACFLCKKPGLIGLNSEKQAESEGNSSLDSEFSNEDYEVTCAFSATVLSQHRDYADLQTAALCGELLQSECLPQLWQPLILDVVR